VKHHQNAKRDDKSQQFLDHVDHAGRCRSCEAFRPRIAATKRQKREPMGPGMAIVFWMALELINE
jgi:hypothetical protein